MAHRCADMPILQASEASRAGFDALGRRFPDLPEAALQPLAAQAQAFLQQDAQQRCQSLLDEHPAWSGRIPLRHLASYLAMTDVSLSRLRAGMGLIAR